MDDQHYPQKLFDEKILFFNNETLLEREKLIEHFSRAHKKILVGRDIESMCQKGNATSQNQDNMFILVDNDVKIFGVFDGHGIHGHRVSSFACGKMLDYVRNLSGGFFRKQNLMKEETTRKDIKR
jgi:hypothetical protein